MTPQELQDALKTLGLTKKALAERLNAEAEPGQPRSSGSAITRMVRGYKTHVGGVLTHRPGHVDLGVACYIRWWLKLRENIVFSQR